uniref:Uncharacterized protein n=1 Tax=Arundo donax TaxID=35708 RepID=A0A0A9FGK7_ARUDO
MSQNSLVDERLISVTTTDLIVGLNLGSSCVHALARTAILRMESMGHSSPSAGSIRF